MTAAVPTPDLQLIVEAQKACRERYLIVAPSKRGLDFGVRDLFSGLVAFSGTATECLAYIDARCAEAMVRAMTAQPVAWRVKDFADSWILFNDEVRAQRERQHTGALIQPLFTMEFDNERQ